jgi:AMP deaminase
MIHLTREPLLEEYSVTAQVYGLSQNDLCEIARNSVLQSGFSLEKKRQWHGDNFLTGGEAGNDEYKTNVSNVRYLYRFETFREEIDYITNLR